MIAMYIYAIAWDDTDYSLEPAEFYVSCTVNCYGVRATL